MNRTTILSCSIVIVALLLLTGTASAGTVHTLNPGDSIADAIDSAADGDTLVLNPGTYPGTSVYLTKGIAIQANTTAGGNATNTIIEGTSSESIFALEEGNLSIDNLTLQNGGGSVGGAINACTGTVTITSSIIRDCLIDDGNGGAIFVQSGSTLTLTSTTITHCSAGIFSGNGGAIYTETASVVTITNSSITDCTAYDGGAIFSTSLMSTTIQFSRIYNNTGTYEIRMEGGGSVNAVHNWWGTNTNPSAKVHGTVTYNPWLVLGTIADPASITTAQTSVVSANLTYDSNGVYHNPASGHVPDGIPVAFGITSGTGSVLPVAGNMSSGRNATTFTPEAGGPVMVTATVDGQSAGARISCADAAPTVTGIAPTSGSTAGDTSVTITGTGFVGATAVTFGIADAASYTVDSATKITAESPAGAAGTVHIIVTTASGTSPTGASDQFTYTVDPTPTPTPIPTQAPQPNGGSDNGWPVNPVNPAMKGPHEKSQQFVSVNAGQIGHTSITGVDVTGTGVRDIVVTAAEVNGPGTGIPPPPGFVYEYVDISPVHFTEITASAIHFYVPLAWLEEHTLAPQEIVLYHYSGTAWESLETVLERIEGGRAYYTAASLSFSRFAITGQVTVSGNQGNATAGTTMTIGDLSGMTGTVAPTYTALPAGSEPVAVKRTAAPAPVSDDGFPFFTVFLIGAAGILAIGIAAGIRRRWRHRQNPALFEEY
jgi:PGF-pre-PGF domain-containing protein